MILIDCCELWIFLIFIIVSSSFHNTLCYIGLIPTIRFELIKGDASDRIRTCGIRVKGPLPFRLATDAISYSVYDISVFALSSFFFSSFTQFIICHNACDRNRTCNLRFKRPLLYQLSYADMLQRIKEVPVFFYSLLVNPDFIRTDYSNGS